MIRPPVISGGVGEKTIRMARRSLSSAGRPLAGRPRWSLIMRFFYPPDRVGWMAAAAAVGLLIKYNNRFKPALLFSPPWATQTGRRNVTTAAAAARGASFESLRAWNNLFAMRLHCPQSDLCAPASLSLTHIAPTWDYLHGPTWAVSIVFRHYWSWCCGCCMLLWPLTLCRAEKPGRSRRSKRSRQVISGRTKLWPL